MVYFLATEYTQLQIRHFIATEYTNLQTRHFIATEYANLQIRHFIATEYISLQTRPFITFCNYFITSKMRTKAQLITTWRKNSFHKQK